MSRDKRVSRKRAAGVLPWLMVEPISLGSFNGSGFAVYRRMNMSIFDSLVLSLLHD